MKKVLTLMLALVLSFSLAACKNDEVVDTSAADLADAVQKLSVDVSDALAVTSDIVLPTTGLHDSVVTWSSNNTAAIANDGKVTRPAIGAGNASVVLTATVTIGGLSETKDFTLKVLEEVPTLDVTITEFNSSAVSVDAVVVVTGVVYGFVTGKGVQIFDGTGFVYVYGSVDDSIVLGDKIAVTGQKTVYYGLPEVASVTNIELISSGNALPTYEVTSIIDLFDEDPYDTTYYSKPMQVTGMVKIDSTGLAVIVATDADGMSYDVSVYSDSDAIKLAALKALAGKVVTADVIYYGYHDGLKAFRVTLASNAVLTSVDPTPAQQASYEVGQIKLTGLDEVMVDLTLPTTGMMAGTTVSWASDNETVISTAGVVNRVAGSDTTVVLTVTATVGTTTATKEFTAVVKNAGAVLETITVAEALLLDDDADVVLQAVVAGFDFGGYPFLQDSDGTGIYTHVKVDGIEVGDEVILNATMSTYSDGGGVRQLDDTTLVRVVTQDNVVFVNTTSTPEVIGDDSIILTTQSVLYKMTLTIDTLEDGSYTLFTGDGTSFFSAYTKYSYIRDLFADGDSVIVTFFVTGLNSTNVKIEILDTDLTAAQNLTVTQDMIEVSGTVTEDLTLITELPLFDATITWASDNVAVGTDGVVTRPAVGEGDATVTLTASVVIGTDSAVAVPFTVTVTAMTAAEANAPELFISEYIEGSGNNKAIEIYNPTDVTVDLAGYSIHLNWGSGGYEYVLTGNLASGEVIVICNSQLDAGTALDTNCDVKSSYPDSAMSFNGNDSLQLLKGTEVIDQIGVEADAGGADFAKDKVMVRNAVVVNGAVTFDLTEWTVAAIDGTIDYLTIGAHTCDQPTT